MTTFNEVRYECNTVPRNEFNFMGYTMRTASYRYTRWLRWNTTTLRSDWDGEFAEELYNHTLDDGTSFGMFEAQDLAKANPQVSAAIGETK